METPETVGTWVRRVFPEWAGPLGRALALVEEAVELGLAAGLSPAEIQSAVDLSIGQDRRRRDAGIPPDGDKTEVADVLLNLYAYAHERDIDPQAALDEKMAYNRSKPDSAYHAKTKLKKSLGLAASVVKD
jgi:hypothetical protein